MKKVILFLLTFWVNSYYAAVITISAFTSDIIASIQGAHTAAVPGDIVVLPSGTYPCNGVVIITKMISITGQGSGNTILYRSESTPDATLETWSEFFRFSINSTLSSNIKVTNICFKSKLPSMNSTTDANGNDISALDGLSLARDCGIKMTKCKDFLIAGCRFENFGNAAIYVQHDDSIVGGAISNNYFLHNSKGTLARGLGYGVVVYGNNVKWLSDPRFGTSNFIFVEDNIFDYHKHSIAAGGCALYAFRHNKVYNNIAGSSTAAIDAHEGRPASGVFATRGIMVSDNVLINTTFRNGTSNVANNTPIASISSPTTTNIGWLTEACIKTRGAASWVWNNIVAGYRFAIAISVNADCGSSCGTYPIAGQTGYLSALRYGAAHSGVANGRDLDDMFLWNNTFTKYVPTNSANSLFYNYNVDSVYVRHGREYHYLTPVTFTEYTYPHPLAATGNPITGITLVGTTIINSGDAINNIYLSPKFYTYTASVDSTVNVELPAYTSYSALLANSGSVYPLVNGGVLSGVSFKIKPSDTVKLSGSCTFGEYYQYMINKTKANITSQKGVVTQ